MLILIDFVAAVFKNVSVPDGGILQNTGKENYWVIKNTFCIRHVVDVLFEHNVVLEAKKREFLAEKLGNLLIEMEIKAVS